MSKFLKPPARRIVTNNLHLMVNRSRSFQSAPSKSTALLLVRNRNQNSLSVEKLQENCSANSSTSHQNNNNCFSFGTCSSNHAQKAENRNCDTKEASSLYVRTLRRIRKLSHHIRKSNSFSRG